MSATTCSRYDGRAFFRPERSLSPGVIVCSPTQHSRKSACGWFRLRRTRFATLSAFSRPIILCYAQNGPNLTREMQLLMSFPSRTFTEDDMGSALADLGLCPSATLIVKARAAHFALRSHCILFAIFLGPAPHCSLWSRDLGSALSPVNSALPFWC